MPAPLGERSNRADATPEPVSAELEETVTVVPLTLALAIGAVIWPVGLVLSTLTLVTAVELAVFPTLSVETARRSYSPSATPVVSQVTP